MLVLRRFLLVTSVLALAACATATPYQPVSQGFGYSDQRLEENRFRVRFAGNDLTGRERVENYLLFRAAEVTLDQGGTHFLLTDSSTEAQTTYTQTISTGLGFGRFNSFGTGIGVGIGTARPSSSRYEAQAFVIVLDDAEQRGDLRAFDARQVMANLEPLIERRQ